VVRCSASECATKTLQCQPYRLNQIAADLPCRSSNPAAAIDAAADILVLPDMPDPIRSPEIA